MDILYKFYNFLEYDINVAPYRTNWYDIFTKYGFSRKELDLREINHNKETKNETIYRRLHKNKQDFVLYIVYT